ncbi:tetratricopeptide repeat protein [Posidoniimonas polymericola]|uniref:Tetratricopeptide repeat protein n=1 Tax=Posidoniimonas polymericola TaxID=2528002 RepID=A0A5C5YQH0_9BACT|nr:alkaline phosphatase family protein [Posidoniimonas polymericola]TWT77113.1 tetratricopeptide repeat protein [Posidoniimonas polymericola]
MSVERRQPEGSPRRVLLVGWDAADWQLIHPLVEQGLMPTLAGVMQRGSWGNLASLQPMLSPILWNSIATGKRAAGHGVLGFTEPDPDGEGVRPSASTSRKCKALWNILAQSGLRSNVVGWYASHPAEPIDGVMVSNQFEVFNATAEGITPPPKQSVHPATLTDELGELRVRPREIDASAILPFIPDAAAVAKLPSHRIAQLQRMLAQTATVHAVATHLMTDTEWDLTAVYYEGIDRFGHEFMEFHPPKMEQVSREDFDAYQHCMVGIYRFHDMMLQTLLTLAGDDTAVIVMSDHGYHNDHLRPDPREGKSGPVDWHRPFGMLAAQGPGVKAGGRVFGGTLLDIAPTVLHLLGLPAGYDMPGRVLSEVLHAPDEPRRIESWEEIDGPSGMHDGSVRVDPVEAREALKQLVELGYIEPPSEESEKTVRDTIAQNQLSLAQSLFDARDFAAAAQVLEEIDPCLGDTTPAKVFLANCYLAMGDRAAARERLEALQAAGMELPRVHMMLGVIEHAEGNLERAIELFERVEAASTRLPELDNKLGEAYLADKRCPQALEAFQRHLEHDPDSSVALAGVARAKLELGAADEALDYALRATELTHYFPRAHLTVGRAMLALGDYDGAVEALQLCIGQAPRHAQAHRALAAAYRALGASDKAVQAEFQAKQLQSTGDLG